MTQRNWMIVAPHEHTRTDMMSDVMQADWAILLDHRGGVLRPQIQLLGETGRKEAAALLREAANVLENEEDS